jgi:transcriptional regulator with XRE-family HTH domain
MAAMIRFHRKAARISQLELAKFAGVGKTAVFDLEQGKETVKLSTLVKVLKILNIRITFTGPIMDLFEEEWREKS